MWEVFPPKFSSEWVYSVDGKWFRRQGVMLIHRNATDHEVLWWSFAPSESYQALGADLEKIAVLCRNTPPLGAVSDWKGSITGSVALFFGAIPHQRCLAHVVRDMKRLLPKYSPLMGTQELRKIGKDSVHVKTYAHHAMWITWLACWNVFYGDLLTEKTVQEKREGHKRRWWYTHTNIRAAYRILTKDQNNLFVHLDHPQIPPTNNGLEGLNSNIKGKLMDHRGMKVTQQVAFICWYLIFQKVHTPADLRTLWVYWKRHRYRSKAAVYVT